MAAPENKGNLEIQLAKPVQLPRADQTALMGAEGAAQLPARPREASSQTAKSEKSSEIQDSSPQAQLRKEQLKQDSQPKEPLQARSQETDSQLRSPPKSVELKESDPQAVLLSRLQSKQEFQVKEQIPVKPQEAEPQIKLDKHIKSNETQELDPNAQFRKELNQQDLQAKEQVLQNRIEDISILVARSEQERKALLNTLFAGHAPDREILAIADSMIQLSGNAALIDKVNEGSISQEALAKHLLAYIQQQRSFDCSARELAMLDSLEFQLIRILQQINPNIRVQQQQQQAQDEAGQDDDGGGSGPEKAEDEKESGLSSAEEFDLDTDSDVSYSPRSKKGKARARSRARDRKSRFKKWLERMMRVFRRQSLVVRGMQGQKSTTSNQIRDKRFITTVRIFGKVVDSKTRAGIEGVQIVSNTLGITMTAADGGFAFENVAQGTAYSIAPIKYGCLFSPLSINDVALDYREHIFEMVSE